MSPPGQPFCPTAAQPGEPRVGPPPRGRQRLEGGGQGWNSQGLASERRGCTEQVPAGRTGFRVAGGTPTWEPHHGRAQVPSAGPGGRPGGPKGPPSAPRPIPAGGWAGGQQQMTKLQSVRPPLSSRKLKVEGKGGPGEGGHPMKGWRGSWLQKIKAGVSLI